MRVVVQAARPSSHRTQHVRARPLLGTIVEIAASGPSAVTAVERAFDAVTEVHRLMSYHDPESELSVLNREAAFGRVTVSSHTWTVLKTAQVLAKKTGGLFDITVAPALTSLGYLPRRTDFPRASGHGDWRHVELSPGFGVRFTRRVRIDLGGIAKGYAVDRAVEVLEEHGISTASVNAGGDLRVLGRDQRAVYVRRPSAPSELWPLIQITTGAAATSADYFRLRRWCGRRVTPLIHPRSRKPCPSGRSVTVLARDCMIADALTKVVHADPAEAGTTLAAHSACALIVEETEGVCRFSVFDAADGRRWRETELLPVPAGQKVAG
ncbi:MAG: FAD:protein FMN transferase [Acidobacteriota bacterium]